MKLPYDWYDFKIVQTIDGCFTGQIRTEKPKDFTEVHRELLGRLTKQYIEEQTNKKVEQYSPNVNPDLDGVEQTG